MEREAETSREQDHIAPNEMLKSFTEHHTNLFIQSCPGDEVLVRMTISCHYAVDVCGGRWQSVVHKKNSTATEHGLNWRHNPLNLGLLGKVRSIS